MKSDVRALCALSTVLVTGCFLVGCEPTPDPVSPPSSQASGSGGQPGSGGSTPAGTGGNTNSTGGSTSVSTGGASTGGTVGTGGMIASTGGTVGTGGMIAGTGGKTATGGAPGPGTGGTPPVGGAPGKGGAGGAGNKGGATGNGGAPGGGGTSGGGFAPVAAILGTSCGTGTCHQPGGAHVDLTNTNMAALYTRIVGAMPAATMTPMACKTMMLVAPGSPATSIISLEVKGTTGCTKSRMPNMCSATTANPRACLTMPQTTMIDAWITAGAAM